MNEKYWFCYEENSEFWLPEFNRPDEVLMSFYRTEQEARSLYGENCKFLSVQEAKELFRLDEDEVGCILECIQNI
jgi:hypothetical protein